jgi:hypothetical protein
MTLAVKDDTNFGLFNEQKHHTVIEKFLGCGLIKAPYMYATLDFWNEKKTLYAEMKSRRIHSTQYDTSIIGKNKIDACKADPSKEYYFFYVYNDGVFYIKYDEALFSTFEVRDYKRFDRSDRREVPKPHYFIPNKLLKKIEV